MVAIELLSVARGRATAVEERVWVRREARPVMTERRRVEWIEVSMVEMHDDDCSGDDGGGQQESWDDDVDA